MERPCIGQGRAGMRRKRPDPINQPINQPSDLSQKIPGGTKIETGETNQAHSKDPTHIINNADEGMTHTNLVIPDVPFHPGPLYRPPPKLIRHDMSNQQGSQSSQSASSIDEINPNINLEFEENSPFQEGVMSKTFQRPVKLFFQEPKELGDLINKGNLIHKFLPKQTDIGKNLKLIQRKVLRGTHLPVKIKEIQAGYLDSSYFKDIYIYLS